MKANELMIGDWFIPYGKTKPDRIHGISYTDEPSGTYAMCSFEYNPHILEYPHLIKPVSITPEILEKNGLVFDGTQTWKLKEKKLEIMVVPVQPDNEFWDEFSTRIEVCTNKSDMLIEAVRQIYVHQLQQMLRIAGGDKEIVL